MSEIKVVLSAEDHVTNVINSVAKQLGVLSTQGVAMGIGMKLASTAIDGLTGIIGGSIEKYKEWETSVMMVNNTLKDQDQILLPNIIDKIKKLSGATGESATVLMQSYETLYKGGKTALGSLEMLTAAERLHITTGAELADTTSLMNTASKIWNLNTSDSMTIAAKLNTFLDNTNYTASSLTESMRTLGVTFQEVGVNIEQYLAMLMTGDTEGASAMNTNRGLTTALDNLLKPSAAANDLLREHGLILDPLIIKSQGFTGVINEINSALGGNIGEMTTVFGSAKAATTIMAMSGDDLNSFAKNLNLLGNSTEDFNKDYGTAMSTFASKSRQWNNVITSVQTDIGAALAGGISGFDIGSYSDKAVENVSKSLGKAQSEILYNIGRYENAEVPVEWLGETTTNIYSKYTEEVKKLVTEAGKAAKFDPIVSHFKTFNTTIMEQSDLYQNVVAQLATYKNELADLYSQQNVLTQVHEYNEALKFIPYALKNATYDTYIFDESTRALVDSIRIQTDEIKRLQDATNEYTMIQRANSIETMQIQLSGMEHRGRLTRSEQSRLKELQKIDLEYKISTTQNQQSIEQIKQNGLNADEIRLEDIVMAYNTTLYQLTDTYKKDYDALSQNISDKQSIIKLYNETFIPSQYKILVDEQNLFNEQYNKTMRQQTIDEQTELTKRLAIYVESQREILLARRATTLGQLEQVTQSNPFQSFMSFIPKFWENWLPQHALGGFVTQTHPAIVHKGENIIPANQVNRPTAVYVKVEPITVHNYNYDKTDTAQLAQKLQLAVQQGLISGITTRYS